MMVTNYKAHCHSLPNLQLFVRTEIVNIACPSKHREGSKRLVN